MLFWVKDAPHLLDEEETQDRIKTSTTDRVGMPIALDKAAKVVQRGLDGKNVIREHPMFAKL